MTEQLNWTDWAEGTLRNSNPAVLKRLVNQHKCYSILQEIRDSWDDIHWKDWCRSWNSNTLATWCEELAHWKRHWCWERLKVGGEGDDRGWDGWMALPTQWTWVWVNSGSWWWTGRPGVMRVTGSQRVGHDWATELNWDDPYPGETRAGRLTRESTENWILKDKDIY